MDDAISLIYSQAWVKEPKNIPFTQSDIRIAKERFLPALSALIGECIPSEKGMTMAQKILRDSIKAELRRKGIRI